MSLTIDISHPLPCGIAGGLGGPATDTDKVYGTQPLMKAPNDMMGAFCNHITDLRPGSWWAPPWMRRTPTALRNSGIAVVND